MRRRANGNDAVDTINAAATAIAYVENRNPQSPPPAQHDCRWSPKRWGSCWSMYWCFGSSKSKRIGHAVLIPEPNTAIEHPSHPPSTALPFFAPPSSPASFLPSGPPSVTQSPSSLISFASITRNMYSPSGPLSVFTLGPYAHEPQLVSPPVFSTFTTEPSTAPYTPPPESAHLTTPSSPEVPFARLLEPHPQTDQRLLSSQYEFQLYQLQPGSPASHLISPRSGTSSPFPDRELVVGHPFFYEFRTSNTPKLLTLDKIVLREFDSSQESGSVTPNALTKEVVHEIEEGKANSTSKNLQDNSEEKELSHHKKRTITLGSSREFNFGCGNSDEPTSIDSTEWWANEKDDAEDENGCKNWSFFPTRQSGIS